MPAAYPPVSLPQTGEILQAFYRFGPFDPDPTTEDDRRRWYTLDEILYPPPSSPQEVGDIFRHHPFLQLLYQDRRPLPLPTCVYRIDPVTGEYLTPGPLDIPSKHPWLGDHWYFTSVPPDSPRPRYALFLVRDQYLLHDVTTLSDDAKRLFDEAYQDIDAVTLYYQEGGKQFWCAKSPDNFTRI